MSTAYREKSAVRRLSQLPGRLAQRADFAEFWSRLEPGRESSVDGVWGAVPALLAAALAQRSGGPVLVVAPRPADMEQVAEELELFLQPSSLDGETNGSITTNSLEPQASSLKPRPDAMLFPFRAGLPDEESNLIDDETGQRLRVLKRLVDESQQNCIIVTCIQAVLQGVPEQESLTQATRRLTVGQALNLDELLTWLVEHGFQSTTAVELPGEFAVRGGILDLYAADFDDPVRIESFDDQVESIRRFSVTDQRSLGTCPEIDIIGIDPRQPGRAHLASYLPNESVVLLLEPAVVDREGRQFIERSPSDGLHTVAEVFRSLYRFPIVTGEPLAHTTLGEAGQCLRLPVQSVERFSGGVERVREELEAMGRRHEIILVCPTEAEAQRLSEMFADTDLISQGKLHFAQGRLHSGFRLLDEYLTLIGSGELFGRTDLARPTRRHATRAIESFLELKENDLVVHLAHGIARYRGMQTLKRTYGTEEHLELEFADRTKMYVPASKINLVQKYVGGKKGAPSLAKIGGKLWSKQKTAAWAAVTDLAADMLEVQAARELRPGIRFPADTAWQQEFDAAFPYRETTDQLSAIDAIKGDMQRPRPMDRLLCGDVGFGKTEVAMRAAFKAIDNGYQVAILAPTTILVEQHYHTLLARMAEFPFEIARLSRFCTTRDEREILAGLEEGRIDIVVGTHRLASADVKFHNLGVLIIDEEQRFGVEVKERLKALRQTVDVLTMTATPIPRTLNMSLLGLRDISNLETPPDDRIAVETRVVRWDDALIRQAMLRELNRGGQIYFVHNRVADIENVAYKLQQLVPEASYVLGHGQMHENDLERVMVEFINHRADVLVATTIIESGLDIPNANTIFIDEAHRYGLADLHQLRGRVGRYKHRAHCYLLIEPHRHLTSDAARRLRAIEEYSRLGAGFAIAMRDLEIRGAGNILGTQQSGHIAAIGYELYCQMLEQVVRAKKQLPASETWEIDIDLPISATIPPTYVSDLRIKVDLYRRLSRIASEAQLRDFRAELHDRFGAPPEELQRLLALAELRIAAAGWRIRSIRMEPPYLVLAYADPKRIKQLASRHPKQTIRVVDDRFAYYSLPDEALSPEELINLVKSLLQPA